MKKFLIPLFLMITAICFTGCTSKEASLPEKTDEQIVQEVQNTSSENQVQEDIANSDIPQTNK